MNNYEPTGQDAESAEFASDGHDGADLDEQRMQLSAAFQTSQARSRSGALAVVTTPQGLPVAIRIDNSQLTKQPQALANEILRLCRQSAMVAGIRLREQMTAQGTASEVIDALKLPRPDDLARAEHHDDDEADATASWLRSV